jgi:hypothetical protein
MSSARLPPSVSSQPVGDQASRPAVGHAGRRCARVYPPRQFQTPVRTYRHPRTGRHVTLIGTMHVGTAQYYAALGELVSGLEAGGAVVFCEGTRQATVPNDQALAVSDAEAAVLEHVEQAAAFTARRVAELGWVTQLAALPHRPGWRIADLSMLEVIRRAGVEVMAARFRRTLRRLDWSDGARRRPHLFRLGVAVTLRTAGRADWTDRDAGDQVLVHERTAVVLAAVHGTDRDAVLLWGAAHLPGLEADLANAGYEPAGERWYTVATVPRIWRAIIGAVLGWPAPGSVEPARSRPSIVDARNRSNR